MQTSETMSTNYNFQAHATALTNAQPTTADLSEAMLASVGAEKAQAKLLLVEDDRAVRRYLEVILQRAGYEVTSTADGLEAMKASLTGDFDIVVTDAVMPHLNGYELCRFLRRHPKLASKPIVLLSGTENIGASNADAHSLTDARLAKPVRPNELLSCLQHLLSE